MVSLPKINLGVSRKKNFFDMSHDVNTTSDFGFLQPTLVKFLYPDCNIKLTTSSFVRLAPMPTPSFARVQVRSYNVFVPLKETWLAADSCFAQQSVSSYDKTYVPDKADYITIRQLLGLCTWSHYPHNVDDKSQWNDVPVIPIVWWRNMGDTQSEFTPLDLQTPFGRTIDTEALLDRFGVYPIQSTFQDVEGMLHYGASLVEDAHQHDDTAFWQVLDYMSPTLENADFITKVKYYDEGDEELDVILTLHLTHTGEKLFKVLRGIGLQFKDLNLKVPMYLLYSYYKAWFDQFGPHRDITWKSTSAYKLIHRYYDLNQTLNYLIATPSATLSQVSLSNLLSFLRQLPRCCYAYDIDPLTCCLNKPFQNATSHGLTIPVNDSNDNSYIGYGDIPVTGYNDFESMEATAIRGLLKLLPFVNKDSVIGKRVDKWLTTHYGAKSLAETNFLGGDSYQCMISDIFNQSETETALLGEYAGKGTGAGRFKEISFEAKEFGVFVQMMALVPFGGYSQGIGNDLNVNRDDFYLNTFDSLGYEAVSKMQIFGSSSLIDKDYEDEVFGFRPRMMKFKYMNNLRNGCFARRGTQGQFLPYMLDRLYTEDDLIRNDVGRPEGEFVYDYKEGINQAVSTNLRYVGQSEELGHYDRIFYDARGVSDNFILNIVQDFKMWAPFLSISQSFDTFDDEGLNKDDTTVDVQHS